MSFKDTKKRTLSSPGDSISSHSTVTATSHQSITTHMYVAVFASYIVGEIPDRLKSKVSSPQTSTVSLVGSLVK